MTDHRAAPLDLTQIADTLLWLAERTDIAASHADVFVLGDPMCAACGHGRSSHVVGGDADNPQPWPCAYPKSAMGAPHALCRCNDYLRSNDD